MAIFDDQTVAAVVAHMDEDHEEDNLIIARAFGAPGAVRSEFVNLDDTAGYWRVTEGNSTREIKIDWPSGKITERPEIRREVVFVFREACKRLGIDMHADETHDSETVATKTVESVQSAETPFAQVIREGSWNDHEDSEGADFMASIMRGTASLDDYIQLVVQHYFMYVALEEVSRQFASDERFAPFHSADLLRMKYLKADLEFLIGADWRDKVLAQPATVAYANRIKEVGEEAWIPGLVAHHYTRYLGDLSGGQMIAKRVAKQHGFEAGKGVEFYNFESLGSLNGFKNRYRDELNRFGETLDEAEKQKMLAEVRAAYRFNTEVFIDMARAKATA